MTGVRKMFKKLTVLFLAAFMLVSTVAFADEGNGKINLPEVMGAYTYKASTN